MLKEIEILFISLHCWDVCIYIVIFWYHKYIHQVIIGGMMFCWLQFGNITNKILQDVLLFGVSVVFSLTIIGNKMSDRAKLCFKIIIYQIIGLRELPRFLVIFCHYNFFPCGFNPRYWRVIHKLFQQCICCCMLSIYVDYSVHLTSTNS